MSDAVESVFRLPISFLETEDAIDSKDPLECPGPNSTYRMGVNMADAWASRLRQAIFQYHLKQGIDFSRRQNADRGKKAQYYGGLRFWTALEQHAQPILLWDVAVRSSRYWSTEGDWLARSPWGRVVRQAARDAYDFACPHTTPRQIRAFAAGLDALFRPPKNTEHPEEKREPTDTEVEDGED